MKTAGALNGIRHSLTYGNLPLTCSGCKYPFQRNLQRHDYGALAIVPRRTSSNAATLKPVAGPGRTQTKSSSTNAKERCENPVSEFFSQEPKYCPIDTRSTRSTKPYKLQNDLITTRPAPLEPVSPASLEPDGSLSVSERFKFYFRTGKSYVKFYKAGLKNIWNNYKELRQIKRKLRHYDIIHAVKFGGQQDSKSKTGETIPHITRRELQLYLRTRHDLKLLIPFSLVFAIFGEFTPLVILAIGSAIVPYTCRIPRQQIKDYAYQYNLFRKWSRISRAIMLGPVQSVENGIKKSQFVTTSVQADVMMSKWIRMFPLWPLPYINTLYSDWIVNGPMMEHWDYMLCDIILIRREGGFAKLPADEIILFAQNYGLLSLPACMADTLLSQIDPTDPTDRVPWKAFSEKLRTQLIPILEREADFVLEGVDWRRLKPTDHYLAVMHGRWYGYSPESTTLKEVTLKVSKKWSLIQDAMAESEGSLRIPQTLRMLTMGGQVRYPTRKQLNLEERVEM